ncbi:MAG TPA: TetR/AcrR family transcriptional regulator [Polyangiaceae bacterium LLY-WYZ-15_(1-7)]|nr:TetR family transcriptional regulator [Myxococcales bacterium]MAT24896.1 TetR family transcriptional regulator [Sandaracinus sp.]HJK93824.1 TetR/AcrR family transcriptional regulator [Polyangiaceae bacterium LLY-WYZ-15_(1-7)]HJL00915.1 TetR/AcrR family transcriptional regulator [Polyangiaceae bacterium LLY-WYZ-15_(1-7)]HJL12961.1 TetR/AcrR family transcriptional regulator [Polyangiaceae bacterium LLY-WYZ-15_(1-7)]
MSTRRRKRMSAAERRAQLIEVGREVFAERGYEPVSVEEIASAAGVSKPVVYEHFGGKEGLYAVVVDREMERVVATISEAIVEGSPRERAEAAIVAFLEYVRNEPAGFAVLCHDAPTAVSGGRLASLLSTVASRVEKVFAASFQDAGFDPKYAAIYAQALIGMVTYVGRWWVDHPELPADKVAEHLAALSWMGLRHLPRRPDRLRVPKKKKKKKKR